VKRGKAALIAVVVIALSAGAGVGAWLLAREPGPRRPEISVYSNRHSLRVGPYLYCNVLNLDDCQNTQTQGELAANDHFPVQLSVPETIGRAPWRLLQVYEDPANTSETVFRPNSRLAVTIPTIDPHRGRLTGIVVQLLTLVVDQGQLNDITTVRAVPHAEWSVHLNY
jgi:Protein of unknown function (DUF2771)